VEAVSPQKLIVPLDTHVIRVGRRLGLTRYTAPDGGWRETSPHRCARWIRSIP
jgi:endonuclease III